MPRTYPFAPPGGLRAPSARDALPSLYADGAACSTGCRAPGAAPGWPVRPFRGPHLLRAGLNELRRGNLHFGVDVFARDGSPVYAPQGGPAHVVLAGGDSRVQVGRFELWHVRPRVREGQLVRPYRDVVGTVLPGHGHVHVSELLGGRYLNPLRPGGRVLAPWRDRARPVLDRPRLGRRGAVLIRGFDPQLAGRRGARAPVLGLAGLAYRLFDARGRRLGPLRWALRGSRHGSAGLRRRIYARGSHAAGALCALLSRPCRPNWVYRLAGGLAPRLDVAPRRVRRLAAYAWDWAGNRSAIDVRFVYAGGEPFVGQGRR